MGMSSEGSVRRRRPKGEPRRLLVESATYLFNERGYAASTRDIAERAGVSETLMFRYFGSKAELFRLAIEAWSRPCGPPRLLTGLI
jgi:AcrR family transcriptional regulator